MKWYGVPLVDDNKSPAAGSHHYLAHAFIAIAGAQELVSENWNRRIVILTVMQNLDNRISFSYGRSLVSLYFCRRLKSRRCKEKEAPTDLPVANRAHGSDLTKKSRIQNIMTEASALNPKILALSSHLCKIATTGRNFLCNLPYFCHAGDFRCTNPQVHGASCPCGCSSNSRYARCDIVA